MQQENYRTARSLRAATATIPQPEDQKILFDKFTRSLTSKEYKKGLGVGLYITYQIIKAHKGNIKVSSKAGKGSTFVVDLPIKSI